MSDATDESGNFDATNSNVNFNVQGKFGNAGEFNGSSSFLTLPSNTTISQQNNFTLSFWVKPNGFVAYGAIATFYSDYRNYIDIRTGGVLGFRTTTTQLNTPSGSITDGVWQHIALTKSSTEGTVIYVDGVSVASNPSDTANATNFQQYSYGNVFGSFTGTADFFPGSIDQFRIFNKALSSTEVTTLNNEVYCQPTIVPTDYFNTVLWSNGVGQHQTPITGVGFQPDLTWIKMRDAGQNHVLTDSVRGVTKTLESSTSDAQETVAQGLTAFNSDGFALGNDARFNSDERSGVAWNWLGGGNSNTFNVDGTGYSTASAAGLATGTDTPTGASVNTAGGFSIIKLTASSTANSNRTVAHGLGVKPSFVLFRRTASSAWFTWSAGLSPESYYIYLQDSYGVGSLTQSSNAWGNQSFTSQHISWRNSWTFSPNEELIAYVFADIDGYQKSGSYVGTGATGNNIVTNFRPAFLMIKNTTGGSSWVIFDNKRNPSNPKEDALFPNLSSAEYTFSNTGINFLSNGFSLISNPGETNLNNNNYIFLAIAEEVFNPSGVTRNATNPFGDASELALYKFEDNANDAEGNYNGTASNVTYATGYIDKAAVFNGSSSIIRTDLNSGSNNLTYSAWINITAAPSQAYGNIVNGRKHFYTFLAIGQNRKVWLSNDQQVSGDTGDSGYATESTTVLSLGVWYHIVGTLSSTDGGKIYINGILNNSSPNRTANAPAQTAASCIGSWEASAPFNGKIDQVRIFNRALDSGEILQLYNE